MMVSRITEYIVSRQVYIVSQQVSGQVLRDRRHNRRHDRHMAYNGRRIAYTVTEVEAYSDMEAYSVMGVAGVTGVTGANGRHRSERVSRKR